MASSSVSALLRRSETELEKNAFRDYARSKFDGRDDRRPSLPYLHIIKSEEERIRKIRERFKDKENSEKSYLLKNVSESRKTLIQHLSKKVKKSSLLNEQEAERSNGLENEMNNPVNEKVKEPIDEFKAGVMYFERHEEGKWYGEQCKDVNSSSGNFPNQKITMDTILSDTAESRKLFKRDGARIKYFHFPANHMEWIEVSITLLWGRSD